MTRTLVTFALIAFAAPAFAADPVETVSVRYESTYVTSAVEQIQSRQSERRSSLSTLQAQRAANLTAELQRAALLERATRLPISTGVDRVAAR